MYDTDARTYPQVVNGVTEWTPQSNTRPSSIVWELSLTLFACEKTLRVTTAIEAKFAE